MIVEMQKVTILVSARDRDAALKRLRELGVVHIHAVKTPASEDLHAIEVQMADVERCLQFVGADEAGPQAADAGQAAEQVEEILALAQERDELRRELAEHQGNDRWFKEWGEVSSASLQVLRQAGIHVRFYVVDKKGMKELPEGPILQVVKEDDKGAYLAHFSEGPAERLDFREDPIPQVEVGPMRVRMEEIEAAVAAIDAKLQGFASVGDSLREHRETLAAGLEFSTVKHGMGEEGPIAYLQGFCPTEDVEAIKRVAGEAGWAYAIQEPDDPRDVPTEVRTSKWVRIINPVFSFMGTVPGYNEFDISFWFLLFFSLFYAMLVGDGGYGLVFLLATLYVRRKVKNAPSEPFVLMFILSVATIVWGAISGTWFGMQSIFQIESLAFLKNLVIEPISSMDGDQNFMMYMCFLIGTIQLSIAHGLIAFRLIKSPVALSQIGWIGIIWGLFFVAGTLVLSRPFPDFGTPLLGVSLVLVLFFANFQKNFIKGALMTLGDLPLSVISAFSDVVSYLRLFAVGFATFIVASSFNGMAAGAGDGVVGGLIGAVILFLGHGINIILALMAVVVHGIRLNMLEFSGHLNMQWSGKPYRPFKVAAKE